MKFSERYGVVKSNILMELDNAKSELEKKGQKIINLSIGTPDLPPDKCVMEAVKKSSENPENYKYGMKESDELIESVINWYKRRYNVIIDADNIASANGSQEGIAHIAFPICDYNDIVLVPDPGYPIFSFGPYISGASIVKMALKEENNYLIDFDAIPKDIADKAKMMIVSYPNNPTTAVADEEFYEKLVFFAKKHEIFVIHDNAYSELIFKGKHGISFLSIKGAFDVGIEFNSLSKTYNLTGLRISFAIGNKEMIKRFKSFRSQIDYGMCNIIQSAAVAALNGPQDIIIKNWTEYKKRHETLYKGLNKIGWKVPKNESTMFTWYPIPQNYKSSVKFTFDLLNKANILCVPGISFGELGEGFIRMALVQNEIKLNEAVESIKKCQIL